MTLQECYQELGGDFADVKRRLVNDRLIYRYLGKFEKDENYLRLIKAMEAGDRDASFLAAHTLKGLCQNLGLGKLLRPVERITELLRSGQTAEAAVWLGELSESYEATLRCIGICIGS